MSLLKEIFLYTSRFVSRDAVSRLFVLNTGNNEYSSFREEVLSVPDNDRDNNISDFIFGIDDQAVLQRISQVTGLYLFVDYAAITSSINTVDVKTDSFRVAITIAKPMPEDHDQAAELIWQDKALDAMREIRKRMRDDFDAGKAIFWLSFPATVKPFVAHSLANSIGWTMEFDVQGVDAV